MCGSLRRTSHGPRSTANMLAALCNMRMWPLPFKTCRRPLSCWPRAKNEGIVLSYQSWSCSEPHYSGMGQATAAWGERDSPSPENDYTYNGRCVSLRIEPILMSFIVPLPLLLYSTTWRFGCFACILFDGRICKVRHSLILCEKWLTWELLCWKSKICICSPLLTFKQCGLY